MFEESLFLNQNGNTIKILQGYALENRLSNSNYETLQLGQTKSFVVKQGIKEMKVISVDEIMILTPGGELIVFDSNGQEIANLDNLLSSKQKDDGWLIRGLELCPEQKYLSVVSCRNVTTKQGLDKEYDRFLFVNIERTGLTDSIHKLNKLFSVKLSTDHCRKAKVSIPFYHFNCPIISVAEEKDSTKFYFYILANGKCQKIGNQLNSKVLGLRDIGNVPGSSNIYCISKDGVLQKINFV